MFIFIIYFFIALNLLSLYMMFGMNHVKGVKHGYAEITIYIKNYTYSNAEYYLTVPTERIDQYTTRTFKYDIKILDTYDDDTSKVRLLHSYTSEKRAKAFESHSLIIKNESIKKIT